MRAVGFRQEAEHLGHLAAQAETLPIRNTRTGAVRQLRPERWRDPVEEALLTSPERAIPRPTPVFSVPASRNSCRP